MCVARPPDSLEVPRRHRLPAARARECADLELDARPGQVEQIGRQEWSLRVLRLVVCGVPLRLHRRGEVVRKRGEFTVVEGQRANCLRQPTSQSDGRRFVLRLEHPVVGVPDP